MTVQAKHQFAFHGKLYMAGEVFEVLDKDYPLISCAVVVFTNAKKKVGEESDKQLKKEANKQIKKSSVKTK